ncbi:MAG: hypothetical protein FWD18_01955 [Micrococcales bacterium]|nr:hypothetical protein [Micrococcales bacterium]
MSRRHPAVSGLLGALFTLGLLAVAVLGVVYALDASRPVRVVEICRSDVDGVPWTLQLDQADNAALVVGTTLRRELPARAATIGLATALQESKLRNIDYGDRDSLGMFQQRPSQGWGTPEQIMDPVYSTGLFYDHLVRVPGWQDLPITEAAQAVQRSAFPDAYGRHEGRSRAWASGLTGHSPAAVTCTLRAPSGTGTADGVRARLLRDLGDLPVDTPAPGVVVVDARPLGPPDQADRMAWAVAQWAVVVAHSQHLTEVQVGDHRWTRTGTWESAEDPPAPGTVRLTLA